jgi:uncharacterized protein
VEVIDTTNKWFAKGFIHFRSRLDKDWGLTDCVSFVLMKEYGLTDALSADRHFVQAGFRALLLEEAG